MIRLREGDCKPIGWYWASNTPLAQPRQFRIHLLPLRGYVYELYLFFGRHRLLLGRKLKEVPREHPKRRSPPVHSYGFGYPSRERLDAEFARNWGTDSEGDADA